MKGDCIAAVGRALGRMPNQGETRDIENKIRMAHRRLAEADPQEWQRLPADEQLQNAGEAAAQELLHDAAVKRHRIAMGILTHDKVRNYIDSQLASGADTSGVLALERMLSSKADGKNNVTSVEGATHGIMAGASTYLTRSWNVAGGKFLKLLRDKEAESMLVRALHGDMTVPEAFRRAAADFHEIAERLRQRFNAAGGDIGRLINWGMPHSWSNAKLLKAGKEVWTNIMLPLLDRSKYIHEDGSNFTTPELREFLGEAWRSVVTGGANKVLAGKTAGAGRGIKANRNSAERQIHLTDAQGYMQAMAQFSERGVMDAMMGHLHKMSRDIALVEQFGPNADLQFGHFLEQETAREIDNNPGKRGTAERHAKFATRLYNFLAGNGAPPPETLHGKVLKVWRDLSVLKLGGVVISSIGDYGTMHVTAHVNGIPKFKMFLNELSALNPLNSGEKAMGESAGLMVREYSQQLARFGSDVGAYGWSSKLANVFLKTTLLPYATEARRRAFSYGMMDQVGKAVGQFDSLAKLNDSDQKFIKHSGITEADWQVLRLADADDWGGNHSMLTPEAIYSIPDADIAKVTNEHPDLARDKAASNLMALVMGEQDRAVIEPGAKTRIRLGADLSADGLQGFIARSFSLFKSFSFEITAQHLDRALHGFETKRGSAAYLAAIIATTTVLGAVANSIKDLANGRDPRSLNLSAKDGWKNWAAALTTGGGLGLYGDFLINTAGSRGNTLAEAIGGPMVSDAATLMNVGQIGISSATDPDADTLRKIRPTGASAINTLKSYVPGSNLFYTKAAMDRLIFNQISDYLSPGYLARMKARSRQQKRPYWWDPDKAAPTRTPNIDSIGAK